MALNPFDVFVEEHNHALAALEKMEQGADTWNLTDLRWLK